MMEDEKAVLRASGSTASPTNASLTASSGAVAAEGITPIEAVKQALEQMDIEFDDAGPENGIFRFEQEFGSIAVIVRNQLIMYVFDGSAPIIPSNMRKKIADFCCRANFALNYGNFEFNWDQGKLRYKLSLPTFEVKDVMIILRQFLGVAEQTYPKYAAGVSMVINDGVSTKEAVALCKKSTNNAAAGSNAAGPAGGVVPDSLVNPSSPENSARSPRKLRPSGNSAALPNRGV
jgi:hypothetical protein